jgi:hypothetical protein
MVCQVYYCQKYATENSAVRCRERNDDVTAHVPAIVNSCPEPRNIRLSVKYGPRTSVFYRNRFDICRAVVIIQEIQRKLMSSGHIHATVKLDRLVQYPAIRSVPEDFCRHFAAIEDVVQAPAVCPLTLTVPAYAG